MPNTTRILLFLALILPLNTNAEDKIVQASDRYLYIGGNFGLAEPIVKSFKVKDPDTNSNTLVRLKKSHLYGGRVGYSFYPNMMVEISVTHQPNYRLKYTLPETSIGGGFSIPVTPGTTGVSSNIFMANFIYEMQKITSLEIKPYAIFGIGLARISVKPQLSYFKLPTQLAMLLGTEQIEIFKIKKNRENCLVWQVGAGISKDLTDNFSIDFGAKMQVIKDIKIKYQKLDSSTQDFGDTKSIKKTVGIAEFTVGLTYKLAI